MANNKEGIIFQNLKKAVETTATSTADGSVELQKLYETNDNVLRSINTSLQVKSSNSKTEFTNSRVLINMIIQYMEVQLNLELKIGEAIAKETLERIEKVPGNQISPDDLVNAVKAARQSKQSSLRRALVRLEEYRRYAADTLTQFESRWSGVQTARSVWSAAQQISQYKQLQKKVQAITNDVAHMLDMRRLHMNAIPGMRPFRARPTQTTDSKVGDSLESIFSKWTTANQNATEPTAQASVLQDLSEIMQVNDGQGTT